MGLSDIFKNIGNNQSIQAFHDTGRNGSTMKGFKNNDRIGVETFIKTHDKGRIVYTDKNGFRQTYKWGK